MWLPATLEGVSISRISHDILFKVHNEPVSLGVNEVCFEENRISLVREKNQEKVKALLNGVDVGNEV